MEKATGSVEGRKMKDRSREMKDGLHREEEPRDGKKEKEEPWEGSAKEEG